MKSRYFAAFAAAAAFFATSCSEENKEKEIVFPEAQEININIDETKTVSFNAEAAWKLSIDKPWLVFVDGEGDNANKFSQLSGEAGDVVVTITTDNVTSVFETETATIDITMDSKTQPLCSVTRNPKDHELYLWVYENFSDVEMSKADGLVFTFEDDRASSKKIYFSANYDWSVQEVPDWMSFEPFSGVASENPSEEVDKTQAVYVGVKDEVIAFAKEGKVKVTDMNGENAIEFDVKYEGMGDEDVLVKRGQSTISGNSRPYFSYDGYVMSREMEPKPTEERSVELDVFTKDLEYEVVLCELREPFPGMGLQLFEGCEWIDVDKSEKGSLTVSAKTNDGKARNGYVLIVPKAMVPAGGEMNQMWLRQNINRFFDPMEDEWGDIAGYSPKKYAVTVQQDGAPVKGYEFIVTFGGVESQEVIPFGDYPDFAGMSPAEMGFPESTYVVSCGGYEGTYNLQIAPVGFPEEWMPFNNGDMSQPLFRFLADAWPEPAEDDITFANVYDSSFKSHYGISLSNSMYKQGEGMAVVHFYENQDAFDMWKPTATLILIK